MKILVIKSSGNVNGSSNMLADEFIRGAKESGHGITEFDVIHKDIRPCIGCNTCGMNGSCVEPEPAPILLPKLSEKAANAMKDGFASVRDTLKLIKKGKKYGIKTDVDGIITLAKGNRFYIYDREGKL